MCLGFPGPRCSNHTQKQLSSLTAKTEKLDNEFSELLKVYFSAPSDQGKKLEKQIDAYKDKIKKNKEKLSIVQMDYDGTPTGMKELEDKISKSTNDVEVLALKKRIKKAQMLRSWRRNAYSLNKSGKLTSNAGGNLLLSVR